MQIAIASGKGGTGKTTVAVNLAAAAAEFEHVQLLDCDVEEPNCHLFAKPNIKDVEQVTIPVPRVDEARCVHCGTCGQVCAFHAILSTPRKVLVFPELCHGCGACSYLCPQECISEEDRPIGRVETGTAFSASRQIAFAHGILNPGEALASPLVSRVRAERVPDALTIIDAPPGTSCTMVESIRGTDLCLLVTEPTPFGLHDLALARDTAEKLHVPVAAVINRCDIGDDQVETFCKSNGVPVLMRLPLDRGLAEIYAEGRIPAFESPRYMALFQDLYRRVLEAAAGENANTTAPKEKVQNG